MFKIFTLSLLSVLFFLGCSSKEYYKPADTEGSISITDSFDWSIVETNGENATLENGGVITKEGLAKTLFPEGFRFIFKDDTWSLAAKTGGELFAVKNTNESRRLTLPKTVAAAALSGNTLAVVFADNELALYDFESEKLLFKEPATEATAVDMKIANPRFLNDLVLFPTLDGKIVIVNAGTKQQVRTIIVSSEEYFNNIIYFNVIGDTLFAATPNKIYTLGKKEARVELEARAVVFNKEGAWVATKQGELVALSPALDIIKREKFPFAHFLGLIVTDEAVYAAEQQGYIIITPKDISSYKVFNISLDEGYFYTSDEGFYSDNDYIKVK